MPKPGIRHNINPSDYAFILHELLKLFKREFTCISYYDYDAGCFIDKRMLTPDSEALSKERQQETN